MLQNEDLFRKATRWSVWESKYQNLRKMALFLCIIVFAGLATRFTVIAVSKNVKNVNLNKRAKELYTQTQTIKAKRGSIYDANGNPIAEDTSTYSIYAVLDKKQVSTNKKPMYVVNKNKTAKVLAKYLPISEKKAKKILSPANKDTFQVEFGSAGSNISLMTKKAIAAEHLPGINFVQQQARLYPNGIFASNIIGGVALSQNNEKKGTTNLVGQMGLEQAFNKQLKGSDAIKIANTICMVTKLTAVRRKKKRLRMVIIFTPLLILAYKR
nr:hypothetical protein [Lentilactobacillus senioris]